MKEKARFFIAGIFIGLSELLPGISGATVALMFGVYEKLIDFLRKFKNSNLILPLLFGMILSVFLFSSLIDFLYQSFTNTFNILIALLMVGYGIFLVINTFINRDINKGKSFYVCIIFSILIGFSLSGFYMSGAYPPEGPFMPSSAALILFGFFACSFLLFPGISGSAFLLAVGIYPLIIGSISGLNIEILFPFFIGMIISLILMPRLINKAYIRFGNMMLVFFGGLIFAAGIDSLISIIVPNPEVY